MKRLIPILITLALLTGCESIGIRNQVQRIEASCVGFSATLRVLTAANLAGKLSDGQQDAVGDAINVTKPVCMAPEPPTLDDLKEEAFNQAMLLLQAQVTKLESAP